MWCRSCAEQLPRHGARRDDHEPTVIADPVERGASARQAPRPRRRSSPRRIRGIWNVNSPHDQPMSVFGNVHTNPSHMGIGLTVPRRSGGVEGYRDCMTAVLDVDSRSRRSSASASRRRPRALSGGRRGPRPGARPDVAGPGLRDLGEAPRDHQGAARLGGQPVPRSACGSGRWARARGRSSSRSRRSARRSTPRSTASPR